MLLDIHTHHVSAAQGESILNVDVEDFPLTAPFPPEHFPTSVSMQDVSARKIFRPCGYSAGIHPWKAFEAEPEDWERLEWAVKHPAVLAIGEAGLDKFASADMTLQKEVFIRQIMLSESIGKPLIIHCVKAFNELIELKKKYCPQMPWVVHGFRNNLNIARQLTDEGIYFSLGEKYQTDVLLDLPLERILAETDESQLDIRTIIGQMAAEKGVEADRLCDRIDENAREIFFRR